MAFSNNFQEVGHYNVYHSRQMRVYLRAPHFQGMICLADFWTLLSTSTFATRFYENFSLISLTIDIILMVFLKIKNKREEYSKGEI